MKNKEYYANEIINIAIQGESMGVDRITLTPFHCCSDNCDKCIASMRGHYSCVDEKLTEWANAKHEDKYEHDEVVLWRNSMFDEWTPAYYAYYKDGRHYVYGWGCSSLTTKDTEPIEVNYVIKYDKNLAWKRDEY